jgi:hypothetical protein
MWCLWTCLLYFRLSCPGRVCSTADCGALDVSVLQQTVGARWMCLFYSRMCCTWTCLFNSNLHLLSRELSGILQLVLHLACLTTRGCAVPLRLFLCWTWRAPEKIEIMTRTKLLTNFYYSRNVANPIKAFSCKTHENPRERKCHTWAPLKKTLTEMAESIANGSHC